MAVELKDGSANGHNRPVVDHTRRWSSAAHRVSSQATPNMAKMQTSPVHRRQGERAQHTNEKRSRTVHVLFENRRRGRRHRNGSFFFFLNLHISIYDILFVE